MTKNHPSVIELTIFVILHPLSARLLKKDDKAENKLYVESGICSAVVRAGHY